MDLQVLLCMGDIPHMIVCIIIILVVFIMQRYITCVILGLAETVRTSEEDLINDTVELLLSEKTAFIDNLASLKQEHECLQKNHELLQTEYERLRIEGELLQMDHELLQTEYERLQSKHELLTTHKIQQHKITAKFPHLDLAGVN